MWLFTDGGATGNGAKHCKASWAYSIVKGGLTVVKSGIVPKGPSPPSNNRGELSALLFGLLEIERNHLDGEEIKVVSDSLYSINCITNWVHNWLKNGKLDGKKNLDLIIPAKEVIERINKKSKITFIHVKSHLAEPINKDSEDWFIWNHNNIVDKECGILLI